MDITIISDTHGMHRELKLGCGDLLIHAGDVTEYGEEEEVVDFLSWFNNQPFKHKVFIAGNHDFYFQEVEKKQLNKIVPSSVTYLENSSVTIDGFTIYGSPITPYFMDMAFGIKDYHIVAFWEMIAANTDILITHGPPIGILDRGLGCPFLRARVIEVKPKLHCFGHIHEVNGKQEIDDIQFVNAAMVDDPNFLEGCTYRIIADAHKLIL